MYKKIILLVLFATQGGSILFAQQATQEKAFSLKEAQDYAIKNNLSAQNATIDYQLAKAKKNEIRGMGLPQIGASVDAKHNIKVPSTALPDFISPVVGKAITSLVLPQYLNQAALQGGGGSSDYIIAAFGLKNTITAGVSGSQLLFNSDYLVALQASKVFLDLSDKSRIKNEIDIKTNVAKAYYSVLVNRKRLGYLDANVKRIDKLKNDTKALNVNGFVEKIDVDRIEVTYNNLLSEKEKIVKLVELGETLLKFQMGYDLASPIALTDSLTKSSETAALDSKINFENRIEYSLVQSQLKANELELKRNKLKFCPTLVAYGNASTQYLSNTFQPVNSKWYPFYLVGVKLDIPLFDGTQQQYKTQQAKLNIIKTRNNLKNLEQAIVLESSNAKTSYENAITSLTTQSRNMDLASEVYRVTKVKYEQGIGSNIEVLNAETSIKESQTNYFNALYDYYVAKLDYDKSIGVIK